ncbi:MAG: hypothetical protein HQ494_09510 [Rhodospirillales bacterium]|nr:hypothetical protein [Rhodospirillales bacterium]
MFKSASTAHLLAVGLIALSLSTTACAPRKATIDGQTGQVDSNTTNSNTGARQSAPVEFADIPVPKGRTINVDKTMIVGTDVWFGQLTFDTAYSSEDMFTFYIRELPNYGWGKITAVRAQTSFMTYDRQNRVMTIAITPNRIRGSEVTITVSPRESSKPASLAPPQPAPRGLPAPNRAPVTEQLLTNPPPTAR